MAQDPIICCARIRAILEDRTEGMNGFDLMEFNYEAESLVDCIENALMYNVGDIDEIEMAVNNFKSFLTKHLIQSSTIEHELMTIIEQHDPTSADYLLKTSIDCRDYSEYANLVYSKIDSFENRCKKNHELRNSGNDETAYKVDFLYNLAGLYSLPIETAYQDIYHAEKIGHKLSGIWNDFIDYYSMFENMEDSKKCDIKEIAGTQFDFIMNQIDTTVKISCSGTPRHNSFIPYSYKDTICRKTALFFIGLKNDVYSEIIKECIDQMPMNGTQNGNGDIVIGDLVLMEKTCEKIGTDNCKMDLIKTQNELLTIAEWILEQDDYKTRVYDCIEKYFDKYGMNSSTIRGRYNVIKYRKQCERAIAIMRENNEPDPLDVTIDRLIKITNLNEEEYVKEIESIQNAYIDMNRLKSADATAYVHLINGEYIYNLLLNARKTTSITYFTGAVISWTDAVESLLQKYIFPKLDTFTDGNFVGNYDPQRKTLGTLKYLISRDNATTYTAALAEHIGFKNKREFIQFAVCLDKMREYRNGNCHGGLLTQKEASVCRRLIYVPTSQIIMTILGIIDRKR